MANLSNLITLSRILFSLTLLFLPPLSAAFGVLYLLCGISDMADGFVARKTHTQSKTGAKLDSAADLVFFAISAVKLLPLIRLDARLWAWTAAIALIKLAGMFLRLYRLHSFAPPHSIANKLTGILLFLLPLILPLAGFRHFVVLICIVATFAAVQDILPFQTE